LGTLKWKTLRAEALKNKCKKKISKKLENKIAQSAAH
jgi:hypothetical protein